MTAFSLYQRRLWRRGLLIASNAFNSLLPSILGPLVSLLVVRLASPALWGDFVTILIVVQFAAHVVNWGNQDYLLRQFSRQPGQIAAAWQSSLQTRLLLFVALVALGAFFYPWSRWLWLVLWGLGLVLHQSFNVLVIYRKAFGAAAVVEVCSLAGLITAVWQLAPVLDVMTLIRLYAGVHMVKAAVLLWYFRADSLSGSGRFDRGYFQAALPFFLLGLSGMLNSRVDLYAVSVYLPQTAVAEYQIFTNFLLYVQAIAAIILAPFLKSLYRLRYAAVLKVARRLFLLGLLLIPLALTLLHWLLAWLYHIQLPLPFFIFGGLTLLPYYFYLPIIYMLYRSNLQSIVLWVNFMGVIVNLALNLLLLPRLGLVGAVVATAVVRWLILVIYIWRGTAVIRSSHPPELKQP